MQTQIMSWLHKKKIGPYKNSVSFKASMNFSEAKEMNDVIWVVKGHTKGSQTLRLLSPVLSC